MVDITQGLTARIELWLATQAAALLDDNGTAIFKTAEVWKNQTISLKESILSFSPFCFIHHLHRPPNREGDYDLARLMRFQLVVGVEHQEAGIARLGDATHIGTSRIAERLIALLDQSHPGAGFDCDDLELADEADVLDEPKKHVFALEFRALRIGP